MHGTQGGAGTLEKISTINYRGTLTTLEGGVDDLALLLEAHSAPMRMPQPRPAERAKVN